MGVRHYKIILTTNGLVHIGNGNSYGKKEYFAAGNNRIAVLDAPHFVSGLNADELEDYCRFLEEDSRTSLQDFLDRHPRLKARATKSVKYHAEMTLTKAPRGSLQFFDVKQFIKDAYNQPYVPGSSVKGMLRTAILTYLIQNNRKGFLRLYDSEMARGRDRGRACRTIEHEAFRKDDTGVAATSDIMRYISVSDSSPLSTDDLVFAKKYDKFSKQDSGRHRRAIGRASRNPEYFKGNDLNIYRECLKPGTRVTLSLDIDERIDAFLPGLTLDGNGLIKILESSFALYKQCFLDSFELDDQPGEGNGESATSDGRCRYIYEGGPFAGKRCRNAAGETGYCGIHADKAAAQTKQITCYLGGGVDFDSKTVINALFENNRDRVREISNILYAQFPTRIDPSIYPGLKDNVQRAGFESKYMRAKRRGNKLKKGKDDHRHWEDIALGVSPHTVKLGIVGNKKYPMGRCSIEIEAIK